MNDTVRKAGRPKKHLEEDHHYKIAEQEFDEQEDIIEEENESSENIYQKNSDEKYLHDWHLIDTASRNGLPIHLTDDQSKSGVLGFWKKTRTFANATKKWEETGKFYDFITGFQLNFTPKYWRERF